MSCCECCCNAVGGECCGEPGSKTCCKDDRVCCNKVCCPPQEYCCKEVICCPNGRACCGTPEAAECCDEGATCCQGIICCDEGEVCCGTELDPVCCPPGQCCYDGECEPCDCEDDVDCPEGECCIAGVCAPCDCETDEDCGYCSGFIGPFQQYTQCDPPEINAGCQDCDALENLCGQLGGTFSRSGGDFDFCSCLDIVIPTTGDDCLAFNAAYNGSFTFEEGYCCGNECSYEECPDDPP